MTDTQKEITILVLAFLVGLGLALLSKKGEFIPVTVGVACWLFVD